MINVVNHREFNFMPSYLGQLNLLKLHFEVILVFAITHGSVFY